MPARATSTGNPKRKHCRKNVLMGLKLKIDEWLRPGRQQEYQDYKGIIQCPAKWPGPLQSETCNGIIVFPAHPLHPGKQGYNNRQVHGNDIRYAEKGFGEQLRKIGKGVWQAF